MAVSPLATESFSLPRHVFSASPTWAAIDGGCSLLKVIFVDKEDQIATTPEVTLHGHLYRKQDMAAALQVLKARVLIKERGQSMRMTGVDFTVSQKLIEETLGVKLSFVDEFKSSCFAANILLKYGDEDNVFHPIPPNTRKYSVTTIVSVKDDTEAIREVMTANDVKGQSYPTNFLIIGSAQIFLHADAVDKVKVKAIHLLGGLPFLGLAKLVLGTSNYDEIMQLADKGDVNRCYTTALDCVPDDTDYGSYDVDTPAFPFARMLSLSREEVSMEDKAAAIVSFFAQITHALSLQVSETTGISRFYVSGNWVRSEVARRFILEQISVMFPDVLEFKFFKTGLLPAIGSMLMTTEAIA